MTLEPPVREIQKTRRCVNISPPEMRAYLRTAMARPHTSDPRATMLRLNSMEPNWDEVLDAVAAAVKETAREAWILGMHGIGLVNDWHATRFELHRVALEHSVRLGCCCSYYGSIGTTYVDDVRDVET